MLCMSMHLTLRRFADLINVFEVFLPQLLLYPNPADPLNGEAAALMLREPEAYKQKIRGNAHDLCKCCCIVMLHQPALCAEAQAQGFIRG